MKLRTEPAKQSGRADAPKGTGPAALKTYDSLIG
jgi:hypothetical protein